MRRSSHSFFWCILIATSMLGPSSARAADEPESSSSSADYSQLVSIQAGPFRPTAVGISNGSYDFTYGAKSLDSFLVEAGWGARLFHAFGSVYLTENLAVTTFSGIAGSNAPTQSAGQTMTVNLLGFDTRVMHAWDWFPWHRLVPFGDFGYQYTFYSQSGSSDLETARGGVGNLVGGFGLRLWLNRDSSLSSDHVSRYTSFPLFLSLRVNYVLPPSDGALNLASTSYLGGLSFGL